jgi:hypothetical protein
MRLARSNVEAAFLKLCLYFIENYGPTFRNEDLVIMQALVRIDFDLRTLSIINHLMFDSQ